MNDCEICLLEPAQIALHCPSCGEYCCVKCWAGELCVCCWAEIQEAENPEDFYDEADEAAF